MFIVGNSELIVCVRFGWKYLYPHNSLRTERKVKLKFMHNEGTNSLPQSSLITGSR